MSPSSTSSSDRGLPWAGLLTCILVLAIDQTAFDSHALWTWLLERIPRENVMEHGVARDRVTRGEIDILRPAPDPLVMLIGNSRLNAGVDLGMIRRGLVEQQATAMMLAHGGVRPYTLSCMLEESRKQRPDVVVTVLTEFETHRPIQILTHMGAADARVYRDYVQLLGAQLVFRERAGMLGLGLSTLLHGYRYRSQLGAAGLVELRRFVKRSGGAAVAGPSYEDTPVALAGEPPLDVKESRVFPELRRALPEARPFVLHTQMRQCMEVTRGPHALVQMELIERALLRLVGDGVDIIIIEAPTFPAARQLYRDETRQQSREWVRSLSEHERVHWLPLDQTGPYDDENWGDLTHVRGANAEHLSQATLTAIQQVLAQRATRR